MSALDLGPLVLGTNTFGWTSSRDESFAVLDAFTGAGGSCVDSADSYSFWLPENRGGESETIIGAWMASRRRRDDLVIATKVFSLPERHGLSSANIHAAVDDSLRRLQTDHIDVYFAHQDDPDVPQAEYVGAFDELVQAGKILEVGASNFSADRLRTARDEAEASGHRGFAVAQDRFNLIDRTYATDLAPTIEALGMVQMPYQGLASGFLTGKYRPGAAVDSVRAQGAVALLEDPRNLGILKALDDIAADHRVSVAAVALAWLRQQPTVAAPIASARTVDQLTDLLQSFDLVLAASELDALS